MQLFRGRRVLLADGSEGAASIVVENGKIVRVHKGDYLDNEDHKYEKVVDAGDLLLMPGAVDSHVHVNEPGRTVWEGYHTATKAAAAGGFTTIIDMPLNCIPATTTVEAYQTKLLHAKGQCYVDMGFWGGVVPGNQGELRPMIKEGVCGFKCFMIHSGVDEFPWVSEADIRTALKELQGTNSVLLFHAEVETADTPQAVMTDPKQYQTFLEARPDSMELEAIKIVCRLCQEYNVRCHIVHLSTATALPVIRAARAAHAPLTVETTNHYLTLDAETIPAGATQYKCCPPIRSKHNQDLLWGALKTGDIDLAISDHSPCIPELKSMEEGDFMKAWGGIASVQFGLSLFWTHCQKHGLGLQDLVRLLCRGPAQLGHLQDFKGSIKVGYDADFVIWDPNEQFVVSPEMIEHKNKITPYMGQTLKGKVHQTFVRGQLVYDGGHFPSGPCGVFLKPRLNVSAPPNEMLTSLL